jgi:phage tail tube protein FII
MFLDMKGPIVADTVYSDNQLCAKGATVKLPAITPLTGDFPAMGTMTLPIIGLLDSMELSITKIGIDLGLGKLSMLQKQNLEFRWVQTVVKADGSTSNEGCKAFIRGITKSVPGPSLEVGSATENELTYEVSRYQLFVGGVELVLIDRLSQILRINGVDYYSNIQSLL